MLCSQECYAILSVSAVYLDTHTDTEHFVRQELRHGETENPAQKGQVYMDHMGFGMGNCCLQVPSYVPISVCLLLFICLLFR